jgi:hypothetical protein
VARAWRGEDRIRYCGAGVLAGGVDAGCWGGAGAEEPEPDAGWEAPAVDFWVLLEVGCCPLPELAGCPLPADDGGADPEAAGCDEPDPVCGGAETVGV